MILPFYAFAPLWGPKPDCLEPLARNCGAVKTRIAIMRAVRGRPHSLFCKGQESPLSPYHTVDSARALMRPRPRASCRRGCGAERERRGQKRNGYLTALLLAAHIRPLNLS